MFLTNVKPFLVKAWKKISVSPLTDGKTRAKKIAYLGLATAFSVIANTFFEIKLGAVQYSFTIAVCALLGVLMGAGYGFIVCFIGDGIGFAYAVGDKQDRAVNRKNTGTCRCKQYK